LSGPIPSSIGSLSKLEELYLSNNQLSGAIPSSIGNLSQLEEIYLSNNKELSGAFPSMTNNGCKINTIGTGINRVAIKTKPLDNFLDHVFVVTHVVIGYVDLVFDILSIIALSNTNTNIMIANILFVLLSISLGIWMSRNDMIGILRIVLQVDQLYQGYMTLYKGHQTDEMIVSKKIDAVTRSIPGMILQLVGLLKSFSYTSDNSLSRHSKILILSVASAIAATSLTLASLAPNSGPNVFNRYFIIHYVYYTVEIANRVVVLSVMFFTVSVYGYIVAAVDFLVRQIFGWKLSNKNLRDVTLLAIQSFGSDHTVPGPANRNLYIGLTINTIEMFIFLIVLNTMKTAPHFHGASTILTVVACVTWFIRLLFYYSDVLDIVPSDDNDDDHHDAMTTKATPMASREEIAVKTGKGEEDGSSSVNRIDDTNA
jgi:hypothetical protein